MMAGVGLAVLVVAAWVGCLGYSLFVHRWTMAGVIIAPLLMAVQCWLNVGLFIVAHDCMHGSLAPGRPLLNRNLGRLCLMLYAGFSFSRLRHKHMLHHAHPGSAADPDFSGAQALAFWPWFMRFFRGYFGWAEFAVLAVMGTFYVLVLGVKPLDVGLFWGLPAILSAAQLFYFGTFLPHRQDAAGFGDRHNARSNDYSWLTSLLTCFHFGYHHEHHAHPGVPWWRLPAVRAQVGQPGAP